MPQVWYSTVSALELRNLSQMPRLRHNLEGLNMASDVLTFTKQNHELEFSANEACNGVFVSAEYANAEVVYFLAQTDIEQLHGWLGRQIKEARVIDSPSLYAQQVGRSKRAPNPGGFVDVPAGQAHRAHCQGCESCTPPGSVFSEHAPNPRNETQEG